MRALILLVSLSAALPAQRSLWKKSLNAPGVTTLSTTLSASLPAATPQHKYVLTATSTKTLSATCALELKLPTALLKKTLHPGDLDWTLPYAATGPVTVNAGCPLDLRVTEWPATAPLEAEPNDTWQQANSIRLETVTFGTADDAPYYPVPGTTALALKKASFEQAQDWFRFEFNETKPKLVFFQIELMERDQIPADVAVYRVVNGKAVPYTEGEDPVALPHEVQAMQGNKFTTRVLRETGTYYARVIANHPEYKLRTRVYDAPPYQDPQKAVRTALDFLLGAGDSWHANTPRRGGVYDRVSNVHQETSLCVACHVTHFTQRAQLYAARQGYPVVQQQQLQFLAERFYNNPRPLYGFENEGYTWSRMISAGANVLSRMSHLMDLYERHVTGQRREDFHQKVSGYLNIYYAGRTTLPPDETNGNQPLVSAHEVAWYSWENTHDAKLPDLIAAGEVKNVIDLCYQTLGLASIDKAKYAEKIKANVERLYSLQRESGQWSARFDPKEKEAEFQTGHALWSLAVAGQSATDPRIQKAIQYLLSRQQEFGGWLDPLQPFENFRTPFRETQMAALALSHFYPLTPNPSKPSLAPSVSEGIRQPSPSPLTPRVSAVTIPTADLTQLDNLWQPPPLAQLEPLANHADPFIRQQAVETMGRHAMAEAIPTMLARLGDHSKLVQRTAAWALRRTYSTHSLKSKQGLAAALDSRNDRLRWGATRVFAQHFAALAQSPELAQALARRTNDAHPAVATMAVKGLWQLWFWTPTDATKDLIENTLLAALTKPQHPWVELALKEALYNLPDENIRYLYNNWVPPVARQADQQRIISGRLKVEARLAEKFSRFLESESNPNRKRLLAALAELPLRRADVYQPDADHATGFTPVYNRIGNDVEQTVFFGEANTRFATALLKVEAAAAHDPELQRLVTEAAILTRDARFPGVAPLAGPAGPARDQLRDQLVAKAKADLKKPENAELLKAFNQFPREAGARAGGPRRGTATPAAARPDDAFFRGYVEPILSRRGRDGQACIHCHASHAIFDGTLGTANKVINTEDPEDSLILKKPTWTAEEEGTLGAKSHGGGVRFEKDSAEYTTILNWIRGVKE